jgi:hypothetical protein
VLASGSGETIDAVWGSSARDVWVVSDTYIYSTGIDRTIYHFDGVSWSVSLREHVDGKNGARLLSLGGTGPTDVWAAGEELVLHWDGKSWMPQSVMPPGSGYLIWHLWARAPDDVWALGGTLVLHFDGQRWSQAWLPAGSAMFGLKGGPLWSFGAAGALLRHR